MFIGVIHSRRPVRRIGRQTLTDRGLRKERGPTGNVGSWRSAAEVARAEAARPVAGFAGIVGRTTIAGRARSAPPAPPAPDNAGTIDWRMLAGAGILDPRDPAAPLAKIFREIVAPLLERACAPEALPNNRMVLITSPGQGEGKTFTALNLALSLVQDPDRDVLLIDANSPHPGVAALLGLAPSGGLADLLGEAGASLDRTIVRTELRGLAVLGPGAPRDDLADLLAGPRMAGLLRALAERDPRRLIVFDGPCLSAGPEARILASLVGQTLLVADRETPDEAIDAALVKLRRGTPLFLLRNRAGTVSDRS
jgi:Mrp family chromosome partitioning ATPase